MNSRLPSRGLRSRRCALALVVCLASAGIASARTVVLHAHRDTYIAFGSEANAGDAGELRLERLHRVLVGFDLAELSPRGLLSARLVLTVDENRGAWGDEGRAVHVHRLQVPWEEGLGDAGSGATWRCPRDRDVSNADADCNSEWSGGLPRRALAPPVVHTDALQGEVEWDVTEDVRRGADFGWLVTLDPTVSAAAGLRRGGDAGRDAAVRYQSREGAEAAGDLDLAPRLILEYLDAEPPPTMRTARALIVGDVSLASDGSPIAGMIVSLEHYRGDGEIVGLTETDTLGHFRLETPEFTGKAQFLVRIGGRIYSEALRKVEILAGRCQAIEPAHLDLLGTPVEVDVATGGMLEDASGQVTLEIPPGALRARDDGSNPMISVTVLSSHEAIRDDLPPLVAATGTYVDISGVWGERTDALVTLRLPNTYNLPVGTEIPFGKIDHNTLEWSDLHVAAMQEGDPEPDVGIGFVRQAPDGTTHVEVQFDHFCTICTGECLPHPDMSAGDSSSGNNGPNRGDGPDGNGKSCGSSTIDLRTGNLAEVVALPTHRERGIESGLSFGYSSSTASPLATIAVDVSFGNVRPIRRTICEYEIEGRRRVAIYNQVSGGRRQRSVYTWRGDSAMNDGAGGVAGRRALILTTGSYPYHVGVTSINDNCPVAVSGVGDFFGSEPREFASFYPNALPIRRELSGRAVLVNLSESAYGAGWSLMQEERLYLDPDGCVVLVQGNGDFRFFEPIGATMRYRSPPREFSELSYDRSDGSFTRTHVDGTRKVFSPEGRIERIVDRYGHVTRFGYDGELLSSIQSPAGFVHTLDYDARGRLRRVIDSAGRLTEFTVDPGGDLVAITDAAGATRAFTYDDEHRLVEQETQRGTRTSYEYLDDRVIASRSFDTDGATLLRERRYVPSALRGEVNAALEDGLGTNDEPIPVVDDGFDRVIDGRGFERLHERGESGRTERVIDALGRETAFAYEQGTQLLRQVTRPDGSRVQYSHDAFGNVTSEYDVALDARTTREFDGPFHQLSRIVDPEGSETRFEYDERGNLIAIVDALGARTELFHENPLFPELPTGMLLANGALYSFEYGARGNLAAVTDPLGRRGTFRYDTAGNLTRTTDPRGARTVLRHDTLNRLVESVDALGAVTSFAYDERGCTCSSDLVSRVTFANETAIEFRHDGLDRVVERVDQLDRSTRYAYDGEGNVVRATNREGEVVEYTYDEAGQLVASEPDTGYPASYEYDELGYLRLADNGISRIERANDVVGRVLRETTRYELPIPGVEDGLVHELRARYDRVGNRRTLTSERGEQTYTYDALHRPLTITSPGGETWSFDHDAIGRRTALVAPNGVMTGYEYDIASQLTAIRQLGAPGDAGQDPSLLGEVLLEAYDAAGNITRKTVRAGEVSRTHEYRYDLLGQLTGVTEPRSPRATYTNVGYTYDDANRIESAGKTTYTSDLEGRTRSADDGLVTHRYEFDSESQLVGYTERLSAEAKGPSLVEVAYFHDALGRRIAKSVHGIATAWFHDQEDILVTVEGDPANRSYAVHGPGIDEMLAWADDETAWFQHADELGSIAFVTDAAGGIADARRYDAYGAFESLGPGTLTSGIAFTGREPNLESGSYHYRSRDYAPGLGRFLSEDRIGLRGGLNLLAYVGNGPTVRVDPFGTFWWGVAFVAIGAGVLIWLYYPLAQQQDSIIDSIRDRLGLPPRPSPTPSPDPTPEPSSDSIDSPADPFSPILGCR